MNSNNLTQVLVLLLLDFQYQSIFFLLELHPLEKGFGIEILGLFYGPIYASHQGGQTQVPKRPSQEEKNFKLVSLFEIHQRKSFALSCFAFHQSRCQRRDPPDKIPRHIFSFAPPVCKKPKLQKWHRQNFKLLHPRFIRKQNCKSNAGKILNFCTRFLDLLDKIPFFFCQ